MKPLLIALALGLAACGAHQPTSTEKAAADCREKIDAVAKFPAQWADIELTLRQRALPLLIDQYGEVEGKAEFERRLATFKVAATPSAYDAEACRLWMARVMNGYSAPSAEYSAPPSRQPAPSPPPAFVLPAPTANDIVREMRRQECFRSAGRNC